MSEAETRLENQHPGSAAQWDRKVSGVVTTTISLADMTFCATRAALDAAGANAPAPAPRTGGPAAAGGPAVQIQPQVVNSPNAVLTLYPRNKGGRRIRVPESMPIPFWEILRTAA